MSDHADLPGYRKFLERAVQQWGKDIGQLAIKLEPLKVDLDKLEKNKKPTANDKKKMVDLRKAIKDLTLKQSDKASSDLNRMLKSKPAPEMDDKDADKLRKWMEDAVENEGIPLGKETRISADIDDGFTLKLKISF